jgi:hypothetical protein
MRGHWLCKDKGKPDVGPVRRNKPVSSPARQFFFANGVSMTEQELKAMDAEEYWCPSCRHLIHAPEHTKARLVAEVIRLKALFVASEDGMEFEMVRLLKEENARLRDSLERIEGIADSIPTEEAFCVISMIARAALEEKK